MRVLFDNSAPRPLVRFLNRHSVETADRLGWGTLRNGDLLEVAEHAGFDVMLTCDRNLRYQQNLSHRQIAIIELTTNRCSVVQQYTERIAAVLDAAKAGSYSVVEIALPPKLRREKPPQPL